MPELIYEQRIRFYLSLCLQAVFVLSNLKNNWLPFSSEFLVKTVDKALMLYCPTQTFRKERQQPEPDASALTANSTVP